MRWSLVGLLLGIVTLAASVGRAEDKTPPRDVMPWQMTRAEVAPLQKRVSLVYSDDQLRNENAAVFYGKAMLLLTEARSQLGKEDSLVDLLAAPLEKVNEAHTLAKLEPLQHVIRYIEYAAQCRECDWQHPIERENPYAIMLPELAQLRQIGRLMALKARAELAQGNLNAAVVSLRNGYAIVRHMSQGSFLIESLVGAALANTLNQQLEQLLQQPDAPNLFWELQALRTIPFRLYRALDVESRALERAIVGMKTLRSEALAAPQALPIVQQIIREMSALVVMSANDKDASEESMKWLALAQALSNDREYRQRLIERGRDAQQVQAMSAIQVIVVDQFETTYELSQRMVHAAQLPFPQAIIESDAIEQELARHKQDPVPSLFLAVIPATLRVQETLVRVERRWAALQLIEAHRSRDAALKSLVPNDPVTGRPFEPVVSKDGLTLDLPAIGKQPRGENKPWRFEIEWRK